MNSFWLFRSNIRKNEYYHDIKDLKTFKNQCHDFYLLMPIWFLENNYFDEVIIWRLTETPQEDIIFDVCGRPFIQRWVSDFSECLKYPKPMISFWRGGFQEYDTVVSKSPDHFGLRLYLGAGRRIIPVFGGSYHRILLEDDNDIRQLQHLHPIPFYKTANPNIFKPLNLEKEYDICWPANFEQLKYKGQDYFMGLVGACPFLMNFKIVHCGNKVEVAKEMSKKYCTSNITFAGSVSREDLNILLNRSKIGVNMSNGQDGCPRTSTEILMSGTPLLMKESVRLLEYYKQKGVIVSSDRMMIKKLKAAVADYETLYNQVLEARNNELSFEKICEKNIEIWLKT
jgi:hypothetical protein